MTPTPAAPAPGSTTAPGAGEVALDVRGLSKTFGGVHALRDARLTVRRGEIHGLVGENGSGKSTLIKLLAGFHAPDTPVPATVGGVVTQLPLAAGEAARLGLAFVHQDLGLLPEVSVLENLLLEEFATRNIWRLSWRAQRARATEVLGAFGLSFDLDQPVAELRPTDRALLAIARAAARIRASLAHDGGAGMLVLDEPTVYLPEHDRRRLFELMRSVAAAGVGLIFVSHDVDEVLANTDRITVMRDGQVAGTVDSGDVTADQLVALILGRALGLVAPPVARAEAPSRAAYRVEGLRGNGATDVSMRLAAGAIVGLTGLPGAGFDDIPYLLFGAERAESGTLFAGDEPVALAEMTPSRALKIGMALIPADRQSAGAVGSLSVLENLTLQVLDRYRRGPYISRARMLRDALAIAEDYDVRPRDPRVDYASLSGGNQQKVLLAKWMLTEPTLLLLHEPTQGVDIGARQEIFRLLRQAADGGCVVVIASSDHEQLAEVCDEVAIVRGGRVAQTLRGPAIDQNAITDACYATPDLTEGHA